MNDNGPGGRGPTRGDRVGGGMRGPVGGTRIGDDTGGPPMGVTRGGPGRRGTSRGRGRGDFRTDTSEVRSYLVDPTEQYTYIGYFPSTVVDDTLGWYQNNRAAIGLGTIIQTTMYEYYQPGPGGQIPDQDIPVVHTFATGGNESCLQKVRRFIVVDRANEIFVALPIYTYGGRGLEGNPAFYRSIHLHVRDLRREPPQTDDQILASEDISSGTLTARIWSSLEILPYLDLNAYCLFNYPVTFNFLTKWVRVLGQLTEFNAKKLFVRHHHTAARRLAPPPLATTNSTDDGGDDGDDNDNAPTPGQDSQDYTLRRTFPRKHAPATSPRTPSRSPRGSSMRSPALSGSPTGRGGEQSSSATRTQSSPGLRLSGLTLTSPSKRRSEGEANDRPSNRSSKRQNRSSGSNDLMELDNIGRPRRQSQSRSGSAANPGVNHEDNDTRIANDASKSAITEDNLENPQNITTGTTSTRHGTTHDLPEFIERTLGSANIESTLKREIALMRAAYIKGGDEWSKDGDSTIRALSENQNELLNRIGRLITLGYSEQEIEDDLASKMGFLGSIEMANTITGPGAGPSMPITPESSRTAWPSSTQSLKVGEQADGNIKLDEEDMVRLMRAFNYTCEEAIGWNKAFGGNLLGALDGAMLQAPHLTEEQVARLLRQEMDVLQTRITQV